MLVARHTAFNNPVARQIVGLLGWLLLAFIAAALGGIASIDAGDFYRSLVRPDWAPAPWVFGPVWTALYSLMAVAAWLVWRERGFRGARVALGLFLVQLAVNVLWSWIFFAWKQGGLAFVEIILLWGLIAATIIAFWRIHKLAAIVMLPYLAWVTLASVLTFLVWQRNPNVLG